jgi:hypothetical protein
MSVPPLAPSLKPYEETNLERARAVTAAQLSAARRILEEAGYETHDDLVVGIVQALATNYAAGLAYIKKT